MLWDEMNYNVNNQEDSPKSLGIHSVRRSRFMMIEQEHIFPLTQFVRQIREDQCLNEEVPFFDPMDGGINASTFFLLEAPGKKAVESGFISRNNPDETAKNFFHISEESGFNRKEMVIWNIVPWYIGSKNEVRAAQRKDIMAGLPYLERLLVILRKLKAVVLVGKKAQDRIVKERILDIFPNVSLFESPHPSPLFVNNHPQNREKILKAFKKVSEYVSAVRGGIVAD